jgi:predicted ATPase
MTEHPESWQELEVHLTTAVPGFESIKVKPSGGPGTVIGVWNEVDAKGLTLADLSDGTLRLLCWAVLCLSPKSPPLICIDEPELGLHPRVLPIVAGLLQTAAVRVQIVVATHSPYLLSQFSLEVVAAMRKEGGRSLFRRPVDSHALKREVEEIGAAALEQMHISDELETLS